LRGRCVDHRRSACVLVAPDEDLLADIETVMAPPANHSHSNSNAVEASVATAVFIIDPSDRISTTVRIIASGADGKKRETNREDVVRIRAICHDPRDRPEGKSNAEETNDHDCAQVNQEDSPQWSPEVIVLLRLRPVSATVVSFAVAGKRLSVAVVVVMWIVLAYLTILRQTLHRAARC